jgi:hypothetical protein
MLAIVSLYMIILLGRTRCDGGMTKYGLTEYIPGSKKKIVMPSSSMNYPYLGL